MAGIQQLFHRINAIALFAFADVGLGKHQIVDNCRSIGPGAEQVIALEEAVVPIGSVGNHQRLHGHGVLFHQVGNAGAGVDDDLVSQAHLSALVAFFGGNEMLAEAPVVIIHRHAYGGIGIHHLLGRNHLQLVGIDIQLEFIHRNLADFTVVLVNQVEGPFGPGGNGCHAVFPLADSPCAQARVAGWRLNSSRKTG